MTGRAAALAAVLGLSGSAGARDLEAELHGFVAASLFAQDQAFGFGQGQGLLGRAPSPAARAGAAGAQWMVGGDVRESRLSLSLTGPEALGGVPRAFVESDFFTGFNDLNWRIRQLFAELRWGRTVLQGGQFNAQLVMAMPPETVAHLANPFTYGVANIGTRGQGVRLIHTVPLGDLKLDLAAEVLAAKWNETGPGTSAATAPLGWSSGLPNINARAKVHGTAGPVGLIAYVAGLVQRVDLEGLGDAARPAGVTLADGAVRRHVTSWAADVGGRIDLAPISLLFNLLTGAALAPFFGAQGQFGDIAETGWYAQLGGEVAPEWSLWVVYGRSVLDGGQVLAWRDYPVTASAATWSSAGNEVVGGMLKYQARSIRASLEYLQYRTGYLVGGSGAAATWADHVAGTATTRTLSGGQVILTAGYFF